MDETLKRYRESIDNIDSALVFMLAERFKVTQAVGRFKAEPALPAADPGREDRQIARLRPFADDAHLDPEFSAKFLRFLIATLIRHHDDRTTVVRGNGHPELVTLGGRHSLKHKKNHSIYQ